MNGLPRLKGALGCAMVALVALYAGQSAAIPLTTPTTMPVSASVDNDITILVTGTDLGTFSATGDASDTAQAWFTPSGTVHNDIGSGAGKGSLEPASLLWSPTGQPQIPTISLSAGYFGAPIMVTYSNVQDLSCAGGATIRIVRIMDDMATPGVWDAMGGGPPVITAGRDTLDGSGDKAFHLGLTLETTPGAVYRSGACSGSMTFVVEYG